MFSGIKRVWLLIKAEHSEPPLASPLILPLPRMWSGLVLYSGLAGLLLSEGGGGGGLTDRLKR